jgi:hypothetical protein
VVTLRRNLIELAPGDGGAAVSPAAGEIAVRSR